MTVMSCDGLACKSQNAIEIIKEESIVALFGDSFLWSLKYNTWCFDRKQQLGNIKKCLNFFEHIHCNISSKQILVAI